MRANPNSPAVLGLEWPPLFARSIPYDPQTTRGQTFTSGVAPEVVAQIDPYINAPESSNYGLEMLATVYRKGEAARYGNVNKTVCAVSGGSLGGAALVSAATIAAALADPADNSYVLFGAGSPTLSLLFNTAGLFAGKRILRLGLYYELITTVDPTSSGGYAFPVLNLGIYRPAIEGAVANMLPWGLVRGDLIAPNFGSGQVRYVNLGEINPCSPTGAGSLTPDRWPWSVADVQAMTTTLDLALNSPFTNAGTNLFQLMYAALEVVWCEENRQAFAGKRLSNAGATLEPATAGFHALNVRTPGGGTALNWVKPANTDLEVVVQQADSGGPFVGQVGSVFAGQYGPSVVSPTLDSFSVFSTHEGRENPRTTDDAEASDLAISRITPIYMIVTGSGISADTNPYVAQFNGPVSVTAGATQEIAQRAAAPATPYPWIRFWARRFGASTSLTVTVAGQAVAITAAAFDALPEIINGWRLVTLRFITPPTIANTGVNTTAVFTSPDSLINRWEILGASDFISGAATYEGITSAATINGVRQQTVDLAVNIATAAPTVTGLSAVQQTMPVTGIGLLCASPPSCIPTGIGFVQLNWAPTVITGFGYYEVQRSDRDEPTFRTIGKVTNQQTPAYNDFEAKVGIESLYQVRCVRTDGIVGDFPATGSPLPFTLVGDAINTPPGVLIFTSNISPTGSIAFIDAFESTPADEFHFPESDTRVLQRIHGRDFQTAFRPTERGGSTFDRTLLIGNVLNLSPAFTSAVGFNVVSTSPDFVSSLSNVGSGPTFILPDPPPGTIPGDYMLALILHHDGANNPGVVTTPAGWTLIQSQSDLRVYGKFAAFGDPVTLWTSPDALSAWLGAIVSYRNVRAAAPIDDSSGAAGSLSAPSVVAAQASDRLVYLGDATQSPSLFTFTPPAGMTERIDTGSLNVTGGGFNGIEIADQTLAVAGATGTRTATPIGPGPFTSQDSAMVALTPALPAAAPITGAPQTVPATLNLTAVDAFDSLRDIAWNPNLPYVCVRDDQGNRWLANVNVPSGVIKRRRGIFLAQVQVVETTVIPAPSDLTVVFGA